MSEKFLQSAKITLCASLVCATLALAEESAPGVLSEKIAPPSRILNAIYRQDVGGEPAFKITLVGDRPSYSSQFRRSPYSSNLAARNPSWSNSFDHSDYGAHSYGYDFGGQGSYQQPRSYDYTSRYPFSSTQVPAYRYPFARDYYSYGPGYSSYGYAFGYPYGVYGYGFWGAGPYLGYGPYWGGPGFYGRPW